jgi:ornithine carbamoyltransferase
MVGVMKGRKLVRHFLDLADISPEILDQMIDQALKWKTELQHNQQQHHVAQGKELAMIFEKPSTRTRVSFEVGIRQLGGHSVLLDTQSSQLGRGESIADTARLLSRYVDIMMLRCYAHSTIEELAAHATIPVINGLTDYSHPCQVMADIMTIKEHKHELAGLRVAWIGDGNNMLTSWIQAAVAYRCHLSISTPVGYRPHSTILSWAEEKAPGLVSYDEDPVRAVFEADVVMTDTWVSMGDKDVDARMGAFMPYQVNSAMMEKAKSDAIFLHCLPAHREEEVSSAVIDGHQSKVWDQAENRLHVQKAIMAWCLTSS